MKAAAPKIVFRYRPQDCATGVTRSTTQRLAKTLGVNETQVVHLALRELAARVLPQYEADEGPLTPVQCKQIKETAPKGMGGTYRSRLLDLQRPESDGTSG
ncbi:hypothetical protein [Ramlibacter sp.]|uniref:hypothetical protein n=1 Tax=Ramlibacter sp. TaxID=1917967 RepID=UPI00261811F7|nr:hypothetical protein [Ramlibacter sp.]